MYMLLSLLGHLKPNRFLVLLLSRFTKNQQDERFTFDVSKYERIFDELYRLGYIKMSHTLPLLEELKRRAYCKLHSTFSHATNDCNMLRRQIQSAINIGRLVNPNMQVDQNPFPVHMLELNNPKVLVWPSQAKSTKGKNIVISDGRPEKKLTMKTPEGAKTLGGARQEEEGRQQVDRSDRPPRRSDRFDRSDRSWDRSDRCAQ